ncbi:MaoC family dehydratase (plasmid) [Mesorhizobium sp. ORM8.1]
MERLGIGLYYEDLPLGRKFATPGRTVTEADLVNFVNCVGMTEVLFTNIEYVKSHSELGKRIVPGALTFSFAEGLLAVYASQETAEAFLGMEQMAIHAPTCVGDTIHVEFEVTEARKSKSRPHLGIVRSVNSVVNQRQETVMSYTTARMVRSRSEGRK